MARNRSTLNSIKNLQREHRPPKYPVNGFEFILENAEDEPEEVLSPLAGMPRVNGFLYKFEGAVYGEVSNAIIS